MEVSINSKCKYRQLRLFGIIIITINVSIIIIITISLNSITIFITISMNSIIIIIITIGMKNTMIILFKIDCRRWVRLDLPHAPASLDFAQSLFLDNPARLSPNIIRIITIIIIGSKNLKMIITNIIMGITKYDQDYHNYYHR